MLHRECSAAEMKEKRGRRLGGRRTDDRLSGKEKPMLSERGRESDGRTRARGRTESAGVAPLGGRARARVPLSQEVRARILLS